MDSTVKPVEKLSAGEIVWADKLADSLALIIGVEDLEDTMRMANVLQLAASSSNNPDVVACHNGCQVLLAYRLQQRKDDDK